MSKTYVSINVHNCPYLLTDSLSDAEIVSENRVIKEISALIVQPGVSRSLFPAINIHRSRDACQSWRRFPFRRLVGTLGTICKRQLLYMYLMFTHKSSNLHTIMVLERIPSDSALINSLNILFVYFRPFTRKRFSVVNSHNK